MNSCTRCASPWKGTDMERKPLKQVLEENGEVVIRTVGTSMEPLLHANESTVLVRRKNGPCRKGDVVLFLRPGGQYVLHRVVKAGKELRVQGDNLPWAERIPESCVIGVMAGYHPHPESVFRPVRGGVYKVYQLLLPVRRGCITLRAMVGRLCRKWKEVKR